MSSERIAIFEADPSLLSFMVRIVEGSSHIIATNSHNQKAIAGSMQEAEELLRHIRGYDASYTIVDIAMSPDRKARAAKHIVQMIRDVMPGTAILGVLPHETDHLEIEFNQRIRASDIYMNSDNLLGKIAKNL